MSPDPAAPKSPSKSSDRSLLGCLTIIVLSAIAVLVFSFFEPDRSDPVRSARPAQTVKVRVVSHSGRNDAVSPEFNLPYGCTKAILYYEGSQIDREIDVAWVAFRVYDREIADYSIDNSGPHDLLDSGGGSSRLTLPAGSTYYVETTAFNASWRFHIDCE